MNPKHILIPSDLSDLSMRPVERCPEMFENRVVTLLSVVQNLPLVATSAAFAPPMDDPSLQTRIEEARAKLEEQAVGFGDETDVRLEVIVGKDTGKDTAQWAQDHDVDLIALSTHGRTGWRRLVLGSVAESILRHATMPVMAFPAKGPSGDDE